MTYSQAVLLGSVCFSLISGNFVVGQDTSAEEGFVSMFDGKSLDGWTAMPSSAQSAWSVKDGSIVGVGPKERCYLTYKEMEVADFELRLSYRFPGEGNSGVSIRARRDPTGTRDFQAYHADFGHLGIGENVLGAWDFHTPGRTEHRCFRGESLVIDAQDQPTLTKVPGALTAADIRKGDWNDVRIIANENEFKFYINDKLASEFTEYLPAERRLDKGMIQLQLHDPDMVVQFRNLRIKIDK